MTTLGALHYHAYRWSYLPGVGESIKILSSTWIQADSQTAADADEETYVPAEDEQDQWIVTGQCDCEETPDVWESE